MSSSEKEEETEVNENVPKDEAQIVKNPADEEIAAPPPPDGGWRAWLQVLGGFLIFFNIWGIPISFGAFEAYYKLHYLPSYSPSAISWIGTVQIFLLIMSGFWGGPLYDLGYYRSLLLTGSFLNVFGNMMTSLSTQYYQVFLAQGICVGLGCGCLYIPSLALVAAAFKKRRTIAMGCVTSGVGIGGIVYTLAFEQLIFTVGYGWTNRIIGFIALGAYAIAIPCLLQGPSNKGGSGNGKRRSLVDWSAFKDASFMIFTLAQFFIFLGYMVPLLYIPLFAQVVLRTSHSTALYLLVGTQGASVFGRMAAAFAGQYFGVMAPWGLCTAVSGMLCLVWIAIDDLSGFIAFCVLFGFFTGALVTLPPAIFPAVCPDPSLLGTRLGMSWTLNSFSTLIGAPIAGVITGANLEKTRNMTGIQVWSGVVMLVGWGWLLTLWWLLLRSGKSSSGKRPRMLI